VASPIFKTLGRGPPPEGSYLGYYQGWSYILDGARETLVLLGIVVLQADLEVNSLQKLPLLVLKRKTD
jgi:hypothetical protein